MSLATMFKEKSREGVTDWSMSRVLAFLIGCACAINISPAMGWPLAIVCIFALMAVPFKSLFESARGASLLGKLIDRVGVGGTGAAAAKTGVAQIVEAFRKHEWRDGDPDAGLI